MRTARMTYLLVDTQTLRRTDVAGISALRLLVSARVAVRLAFASLSLVRCFDFTLTFRESTQKFEFLRARNFVEF
jgi:hypothetical protein